MTKFVKKGDTYHLTSGDNLIVTDLLPVGTYTVCFTPESGYYLKKIDNYDAPKKLYGDVTQKADRIMNTFKDREGATGVLLSGEKGSGKSMLAKLLSIKGKKEKYPTIVINQAWCGEAFNSFIQSITQPTIILFDEFEKVYCLKEAQEAMLTLLDGVYPTNKLFVLTTNDKFGISKHMLNRPGRLFYNIEYNGLSSEFIREYCEDKLKNVLLTESICAYSQAFEAFNFDMLQAVVEEMNRYGEDLQEALSMLNIKASSYYQYFMAKFTINGAVPFWHTGMKEEMHVNPLSEIGFQSASSQKQMEKDEEDYICVQPSWLTSINNGVYTYEKVIDGKKYKLVLTKSVFKAVDYNKLAMVA